MSHAPRGRRRFRCGLALVGLLLTLGWLLSGSGPAPVGAAASTSPAALSSPARAVAGAPAPAAPSFQASHTVAQFYPVASTPGATILVTGSGFVTGSTQVFFGGTNLIPAAGLTIVNANLLQVTVPPSGTGAANINGYLTIRVNGVDVTTQSFPQAAPDPSLPTAKFPFFTLSGDTTLDGLAAQATDRTFMSAFLTFQLTPTAQQVLAADVIPANANGSRGNGQLTTSDNTFLRAVSFGQASFCDSICTIIPPAVQLTVTNPQIVEGNTTNPTVNLALQRFGSTAATQIVTVQTLDGTATGGSDYVAMAPAPVTFNPTETSKTMTVPVLADTVGEPDETFQVKASSTLAEGPVMVPATQTVVTIKADDPYLYVNTTGFVSNFGSQTVNTSSPPRPHGLFGVALPPGQPITVEGLTGFTTTNVGPATILVQSDGTVATTVQVRFAPTAAVSYPLSPPGRIRYRLQGSSTVFADVDNLSGLGTACPLPTVNPATLPGATVNTSYSQTLTANGSQSAYTFAIGTGSLPPGLALTFSPPTTTAAISGTPTTAGTYNFTLRVSDGTCSNDFGYQIVVASAACPTITVGPGSLPAGTVGTSFSQTFTQSGGSGTVSWNLSGTLPTGLTFSAATATLSGTPTQAGTFSLTVTATDANNCSGFQTYSFTVNGNPCQSVIITLSPASPLPAGTVGTAYSQTFTASGGTAPYTFAVTTGTLPAGLSLTGGVLSGTPTAAATSNFTITATANNGCTGSLAYSLTINPGPGCPTITVAPATLPNGTVNTAYSQTITASGGTAPYTFAVTSGTLPAGLTLSSGGGLSGTPTTAATSNFTITATATGGCTGSTNYSVTVDGGSGGGTGALSFSSAAVNVAENVVGGTVPVRIERPAGSSGAVSVTVTVGATSTATGNGVDYTFSSPQTVNFSATDLTQTLTLPIVNDGLGECDETIVLTLSNPTSGATLGTIQTCTVTIQDDDTVLDAHLRRTNAPSLHAFFNRSRLPLAGTKALFARRNF